MRQSKIMELFSISTEEQIKKEIKMKKSEQQVKDVVLSMSSAIEALGHVIFEGELSSFKPWRSGYWYFDMKDLNNPQYSVPCVMPKTYNKKVTFKPKDGVKLKITGNNQLFKRQMKAQIQVSSMEILGQGNFLEQLHALKLSLKKEGLFEVERKKNIPKFNKTIGIVTSPQGAVIKDLVKIIQSRHQGLRIILAPSKVQGLNAEKNIAKQLLRLDALKVCDVIIIGRGGGSFEDLFSFNKEEVARAIEKCQTPIISAVGHESDHCIADYVADLRAATPSHAAEIAAILQNEQILNLLKQRDNLDSLIIERLHKSKLNLYILEKKLIKPKLIDYMKNITYQSFILNKLIKTKMKASKNEFSSLKLRIEEQSPRKILLINQKKFLNLKESLRNLKPDIKEQKNILNNFSLQINKLIFEHLNKKQQILIQSIEALEHLSPLKILGRGYSIVSKHNGAIKTHAYQCLTDEIIDIQFQDATIQAKVLPIKNS